jgi:hypothetical protein
MQSYFHRQSNEKTVLVHYLDPFNQPFFENQTYNYAMNLYIQRAAEIATWSEERFIGQLKIQQILPPPANYSPSVDERTLYFLIYTAQGNLRVEALNVANTFISLTNQDALLVAS